MPVTVSRRQITQCSFWHQCTSARPIVQSTERLQFGGSHRLERAQTVNCDVAAVGVATETVDDCTPICRSSVRVFFWEGIWIRGPIWSRDHTKQRPTRVPACAHMWGRAQTPRLAVKANN